MRFLVHLYFWSFYEFPLSAFNNLVWGWRLGGYFDFGMSFFVQLGLNICGYDWIMWL
jgi:hypothetical protein